MPSKKSHIKLYADENFPVTSVLYLKSLGYSIIHAFDKKYVQKSDSKHLKISKQLQRVLITLDRDFLYYEKVHLEEHPRVIVISVSLATPPRINHVCKKLFQNINNAYVKDSLLKVTNNKIVKTKNGKITSQKNFNFFVTCLLDISFYSSPFSWEMLV